MAKAKKPRPNRPALPQIIYGHWEKQTGGDDYLLTDSDAQALVAPGESLFVGVYQLTGHARVKNITTLDVSPLKR